MEKIPRLGRIVQLAKFFKINIEIEIHLNGLVGEPIKNSRASARSRGPCNQGANSTVKLEHWSLAQPRARIAPT
jgi:hypothetical protein